MRPGNSIKCWEKDNPHKIYYILENTYLDGAIDGGDFFSGDIMASGCISVKCKLIGEDVYNADV